MIRLKSKICFLIFFLFCANAYSVTYKKTNDQIFIDSDNLIYDKNANYAFFEGHVVLWFNDMILKTTSVKIYYKQSGGKNKIDKIIIPEKLFALKNKDSDVLIADEAVYSFDDRKLTLNGKVVLQHAGNILRTDRLVLITELKKIDAH